MFGHLKQVDLDMRKSILGIAFQCSVFIILSIITLEFTSDKIVIFGMGAVSLALSDVIRLYIE